MRCFFVFLFFMLFLGKAWSLSVGNPVTFDDDTLGLYSKSDFEKDWNTTPTSASGYGSRLYIESDPAGSASQVLKVIYLANAVGGSSAMAFDAPLGDEYTTLTFQYQVFFPTGFTWVKGGKLPGLTSEPDTPTGCIDNSDFDGFSARYMWREDGQLYGYIYNPTKEENCGDYYEGSPAYYFTQNEWHTLKQTIYIGDPDVANGYIKIWVDGVLVIDIANIMLRKGSDIYIDTVKMDTFFGGSSNEWAPSTEQYAYFDNFEVSVT